jgi:hypothetical protein
MLQPVQHGMLSFTSLLAQSSAWLVTSFDAHAAPGKVSRNRASASACRSNRGQQCLRPQDVTAASRHETVGRLLYVIIPFRAPDCRTMGPDRSGGNVFVNRRWNSSMSGIPCITAVRAKQKAGSRRTGPGHQRTVEVVIQFEWIKPVRVGSNVGFSAP